MRGRPLAAIAAELDFLQSSREASASSPNRADKWMEKMGRLMAEHQLAAIEMTPQERSAGISVRIMRPDGSIEAVSPWDFYIDRQEGER